MGDAGNVEHQPVAPIERGERGVAGAPIAEARQKLRLFQRLSLDHDESRKARARVGERKAQAQAEPRRLERRRRPAFAHCRSWRPPPAAPPYQRRRAAARDRSPDAAARGREIAWSSTPMSLKVMSLKVMSWLRHSRRMTRPGRKPEKAPSTAPARARRALMSRAPQAKGPGRSGPAAAGIVALGAAAISKRVSAALERRSAWP